MEVGRDVKEVGDGFPIQDMPETLDEGELEGQGILAGLDAVFEKSMAALEKSFKESLKGIKRSYKEQIAKVEGMHLKLRKNHEFLIHEFQNA